MPVSTPVSIEDLPLAPPRPAGLGDHDYLARLAGLGPLLRDRHGQVLTFSQAHMARLFADGDTRQIETETLRAAGIASGPLFDFFANSLLTSNDPAHRARRTPLARSFARPVIEALRPAIRDEAAALILPHLGRAEVDLVEALTGPLPARVVTRILGAPRSDIPKITRHVYSAIRGLSMRSPEVMAEAARDMGALSEYIGALLERARAAPGDDVLGTYVGRTADGALDPLEIRTQIVTLMLAGADTTRFAIAATVHHLLAHPEAWQALVAEPEAVAPKAAAEGLRFEPPIGSLSRVAARDFELDGVAIPAGTLVSASVLAALRDPAVYDRPGTFDIHRADHPRLHPVFGFGPHRCLGEALARAEIEETLIALVRLAPETRPVGVAPVFAGTGATRSVDGLSVALA